MSKNKTNSKSENTNLYDKTVQGTGTAYVKKITEQQACDTLIDEINTKTFCEDEFKNNFIKNCTAENLKTFYSFVGACTARAYGLCYSQTSFFGSADYYSGTIHGDKVRLDKTTDNEYGKIYEGKIDNKNQDAVTFKIEDKQKDSYEISVDGKKGVIEHHVIDGTTFHTIKIDCTKTEYFLDTIVFNNKTLRSDFESYKDSLSTEEITANLLPYTGLYNTPDVQLLSLIFKQDILPKDYHTYGPIKKSLVASTSDAFSIAYGAIAGEVKPLIPFSGEFVNLTDPWGQKLNKDSFDVNTSVYLYPIYEFDFENQSYYVDAITGKILNNFIYKYGKHYYEQRKAYRKLDMKSLPVRVITIVASLLSVLYLSISIGLAMNHFFSNYTDDLEALPFTVYIFAPTMICMGVAAVVYLIIISILGPIETKFIKYEKEHTYMSDDISISEFCKHTMPYYIIRIAIMLVIIGFTIGCLYLCSEWYELDAFRILFEN
ncbi:MAG: alkaline shock response membrane anchor protein AmaP [Bacteroides sp.]|nr:alkaline shock response membrane anchor protein AmaP [Bacillota bacterium]MCM1393784.1 alkaline shock response membrane anchor protein AmaP [[Eubacterium] siraeum]MCM1455522.1 alkaline shock response membrane anchor protein AmaP [Bacteroides sp.]